MIPLARNPRWRRPPTVAAAITCCILLAGACNADGTERLGAGPAVSRVEEVPVKDGRANLQSLDVAQDGSGFFVGGSVDGTLPGQESLGDTDLFVAKYSNDGGLLWARQAGTNGSDVAVFGNAVAATPDGGAVAVAPTALPFGAVEGDTITALLVVAFDPSGSERWRHEIPDSGFLTVAITVDRAGNVYVGGQSLGQGSDGTAFVRSYDAEGAERWMYRAPDNKTLVSALAVGRDEEPIYAVLVASTDDGDEANTSVAAISLDQSGAETWHAALGGGLALTATVDRDGDLIIPINEQTGDNDVRMRVHRLAPDGTERPGATIDASGLIRAVAPHHEGLIVGGQADEKLPGFSGEGGAFMAGVRGDRLVWGATTADHASTVWGLGILPDGTVVAGGVTTSDETFGEPTTGSGAFIALFGRTRAG